MDKIARIRQKIKELRELLEDHNYYLDNSEQTLGYGLALDDIGQFLDTLEGGSSEIPTLPFAEKEGIPGKDFIPVEWVDACERYGKWIIVKVALISELLFQLLTTGMGGWGKRPEQEPEVDLEKEINKWLDGPSTDLRTMARHFYEFGKNSK